MQRRDSGYGISPVRNVRQRVARGFIQRGLAGVAEEVGEAALGALASAELPFIAAAAVPALIAASISESGSTNGDTSAEKLP